MGKKEKCRINPIAHVTSVAVILLVVFEFLVIFGALELKAQTVAKYAPWAYEPFLRLVGEHPESAPRWASIEETEEKESVEATVAGVTGLEPSAIPVLIEPDDAVLATNLILEATVPLEVEPADKSQEIIPVG